MNRNGSWARLGSGEEVFVPDVQIYSDKPEYTLHPVHGWIHLAVEDGDGKFVGWARPEIAGHSSVIEWMRATQYVMLCKCKACESLRWREKLP